MEHFNYVKTLDEIKFADESLKQLQSNLHMSDSLNTVRFEVEYFIRHHHDVRKWRFEDANRSEFVLPVNIMLFFSGLFFLLYGSTQPVIPGFYKMLDFYSNIYELLLLSYIIMWFFYGWNNLISLIIIPIKFILLVIIWYIALLKNIKMQIRFIIYIIIETLTVGIVTFFWIGISGGGPNFG
jgi:hypothetical protein